MLRDEFPVVEGRALSAGVRMLRDEIRAVESRALSDGVACAAVRILRDELPVVDGWTRQMELQVLECGCHEMNSLLKTGYCGMILQVLVG